MRFAALFALFLAPQVLLPGASEIASDHLRDAAMAMRVMKADSEVARYRYDWHLAPDGNLLLITNGHFGDRTFIDSALVKRRGLAPISERAVVGAQVLNFAYDGPKVTVTRTTPDSGTRRIEHTYSMPVFCFQELDDVLRSLPLRDGYEVLLPLYSEGSDTLEVDTARVVSRDPDGRWTIRFADPAIVATYHVDGRSRRIASREQVLRRNGVQYRFIEVPLAQSGN